MGCQVGEAVDFTQREPRPDQHTFRPVFPVHLAGHFMELMEPGTFRISVGGSVPSDRSVQLGAAQYRQIDIEME